MPVIRTLHRACARFERDMADASTTAMVRNIHIKLADLHTAAADARPDVAVEQVPTA